MPKSDDPDSGFFPLGRIVATPGALAVLAPEDILLALQRHAAGDWGGVSGADKEANDAALRDGRRLLSAYVSRGGVSFWVITETDRSMTTVLLPEEYRAGRTFRSGRRGRGFESRQPDHAIFSGLRWKTKGFGVARFIQTKRPTFAGVLDRLTLCDSA